MKEFRIALYPGDGIGPEVDGGHETRDRKSVTGLAMHYTAARPPN